MSSIKITVKLENEDVVVVKSETQPQPPPPPAAPPAIELPSGIIPSCAAWFDPRGIHQVEMTALPEFFSQKYPSKSPQSYLVFRNYIIKLYRENPKTPLTATTCRRQVPGDACAILRLHAFLEHWGLINYECQREGSQPLPEFTPADHCSSLARRLSDLGKPFCGYCGKVCGVTWHSSVQLVLCELCYSKELGFDRNAFSRKDLLGEFHYEDLEKGQWTVEETTRLLEAMGKYGTAWETVAAETGKNAQQCQARFLEIPLSELEEASFTPMFAPKAPEAILNFHKAMETAAGIRSQEDVLVSNLMSELIDLQMQKLALKSKYIRDMNHILWLQQQQYKGQMQQLLTAQAAVTVVKQQVSPKD